MEAEIKRYKCSEVELEYLLTGEENEEIILFVHGAGTNLRQFFPQHEYFSNKYKVLSVSLRGHGKSTCPPSASALDFSIKRNKDDILELLEHLKLKKVHFIGNSAGGLVGYELVNSHPDVCLSLITFGTTAELCFSELVTNIIVGINRMMYKINPSGHSKFLAKNSSKDISVQKELSEQFMFSKDVVHFFQKNLGNYSYLDVLENMKIPFLLIKAENDKDINSNLKSTIQAISKNKNAIIITLRDAGHIANLDNPHQFNKIVENFITQRDHYLL